MVTQFLLRNDIGALRQIADEIARKLCYSQVQETDVLIQTPISFPSGRMIGVKLLGGPAIFTITDDGYSMREAELIGAEDICRREARKVAKEFDLTFNDWELFEAKAPADRLVGLTSIVANAAALTMVRTCDKFAERFELRRKEELSVRLSRIFGAHQVTKDVDVSGASSKSWTFDAKVALPSGRPGFFSIVTPSPASVVFAYSKFDDVSRLDRPPFLGAVLDGSFEASDKALLARAARKIFLASDSDEAFKKAA
jgi:hypothetical protein